MNGGAVSGGAVTGRAGTGGARTSADGASGKAAQGGGLPAWHLGAATGIGSMPGTDPVEAAHMVAGELPELPHVVELPDRGVGADLVGRAAAMLIDLPAEVVPSGWRMSRRPGRDIRRAKDFLSWDLDASEGAYAGAAWVKVQVAGPWTLAGMIETPSGNRMLTDPGAVADVTASLAEGLATHVRDLAARLSGTGIVVQIDEPLLPAVLDGSLPTASGFGNVSPVDPARAVEGLRAVLGALDGAPAIVHCCHPGIPLDLLRQAGFGAVSLDMTAIGSTAGRLDPIGEAVEAGIVLLAGLVPSHYPVAASDTRDVGGVQVAVDRTGTRAHPGAVEANREDGPGFRDVAAPLLQTWQRLGLAASRLGQVVVTPTCGLANADPAWPRRALRLAREVAQLVAERAQE